MGNLTRDPELRSIPSGQVVCNFTLAINRTYSKDGQKVKETEFIEMDAWGRTAETIGKYCKKGEPLLVEARLKLDKWEDKDTQQKRSKLRVVVDKFEFVSTRGDSDGGARQDYQVSSPPAREAAPAAAAPSDDIDEDVPF